MALTPQPSCGSSHQQAQRVRTLPSARLCVQPTSPPAGVAAERADAISSSLLQLPFETVASTAGEPAAHKVPQDELTVARRLYMRFGLGLLCALCMVQVDALNLLIACACAVVI